MHNFTGSLSLSLLSPTLCHGRIAPLLLHFNHLSSNLVMFLSNPHNVSSCLGLFLLLLHLSSLLLIKLFTFLTKGEVEFIDTRHDECKFEAVAAGECFEKEDLIADVLGGESLLFLYRGCADSDTLLLEEVKDSKETVCFEDKDSRSPVVSESSYYSPQEDHAQDQNLGKDATAPDHVLPPSEPENFTLEGNINEEENESYINEENVITPKEERKDSSEEERPVSIKALHPRYEKLQLEDVPEDHRENYGGSLTGESTSKSSVEWRSSTIFRDSETEYPFSSSSRRSSSRWESYTVFPKYYEGMVFLDRISAQKLSETESLRSIKFQPRSISERIVHKLSSKPKNQRMGRRDPYQELESAYVAQICLAWEALNWNYENFQQKNSGNEKEGSGCPDNIAQEFQQFQVLLQRFIENEPYEFGRRPEVYARRRILSPKLLQVPEFRDSEGDEGKGDASSKISSDEFLVILEDAIKTFMNFLKADKEKCSDKIKALIKSKSSSIDPTFFRFLKKANRKKKMRLKDIGRSHRCMRKRKLTQDEEMEILMALIDLKVVSRVLRMAEQSNEQLHWCEEKMGRVRVWNGKMQRDPSPLFFPVH